MRVLSFTLTLALHLLVGLAFLGVSFSSRIHVDLNRKVYDVVLVNLPQKKKSAPVVKKSAPAPETKKKAASRPAKPKRRTAPKSVKKISAKKVKPKVKPKAKPKAAVKKQQDDRAELQKALGSVSRILQKKKETDDQKLARELAALQGSVQPQSGGSAGRATLLEIYSNQVKLLIQEHWRWPGFRNMPLEAQVVVTLSANGQILDRKLGKSSGRADFDSSVLRAVDETKTLPLPPKGVRVLELNFNAEETLQ